MQQRTRLVPILILALVALLVAGLLPSAVPSSAAGATIKVNRSSAGWGDPVTVTGSGFHAGDVVVLTTPYIQNNNQKAQQITTAGVDNNGNFQVTFLVPGNAKQQAVDTTAR